MGKGLFTVKATIIQGCATNLWVKPSSARPVFPEILPAVAQKTAPEGNDSVRPLDSPVHARLLQPLPNDGSTSSLQQRQNRQRGPDF